MKTYEILGISLLLLILPLTAMGNNFILFASASLVGLALLLFLMARFKPWSSLQNSVVSLYFSGSYAAGVILGLFLILPLRPVKLAELGAFELLPFIVNLLLLIYQTKPRIGTDIFKLGNSLFTLLIIMVIGALIGRMLSNIYEDLTLYLGFLIAGLLFYLYIRGQ
jgi:hypothetical protein